MSQSVLWAALAGGLIVAEIFTGTLYLLVLGLAAGTVAAALEFAPELAPLSQIAVFGAVCIGGFVLVYKLRRNAQSGGNDSLDIGALVQVVRAESDGRCRVVHRGTEWDARLVSGMPPQAGDWLTVIGTEANVLLLKRRK